MRLRRAAGFRRVCVQCSAEFRSPTQNAKYCSECTSNREGTCDDCGRGFLFHCRGGRIPSRCKDCSASHARKAKREYWQKNPRKSKVASPKVGQCMKCGVTVCSRGPSGRTPSTCLACKKAKNREKARSAIYDIECRGCQKVFASIGSRSRKLCDDCLSVYRKAEMMTCVICGTVRKKWAGGGNSVGLCCSKKCAGMLLSRRAKERSRLRQDGLRSLLSYVKKLIEKDLAREARSGLAAAQRRRRKKRDSASLRRRAARRSGSQKHTARAKRRGLPRSYGRGLSIPEVGSRDGWICKLCGWAIPDRSARVGPLAPCVDHIVPLGHPANTTHGHTIGNVQIAHRCCNESKGNSVACLSLIECDNPREHVLAWCISQRPPGGKRRQSRIGAKTPRALDSYFRRFSIRGPD